MKRLVVAKRKEENLQKERMKVGNIWHLVSELHKFRITFSVTLTTLAGFTLTAGTIDSRIILPLIGIFLLSSGSAAFNEYQERDKDALMERTRKRPIPSGRIKPGTVLAIALLEIIIGTFLVYAGGGFIAALLGFTAFIWYNVIYTPLKKISPFAVIPGSVIGAIPPMVGWVVGGGSLLVPEVFVLAFFFFMSQVPHFWLLMLRYGDDYSEAGFPVINKVLTYTQIKRVTFVWIVATSINIALLVVVGLYQTLFFKCVIILSALWLVFVFSGLLKKSEEKFDSFRYFMLLNIILLVIIISMVIDPLL